MKNKITPIKATSCSNPGCQCNKALGNALKPWNKNDDGRVYLINTKQLRVSSTKSWAKTLDQLRQQIKSECSIDGQGLKDHFC